MVSQTHPGTELESLIVTAAIAQQEFEACSGIELERWPLEEGYRSWGGGIGLSASLSGIELDAAYEYINWYLSGWVGGFLMRQGYYSAVPETSKNFMSEDEWGFWFEGKAA